MPLRIRGVLCPLKSRAQTKREANVASSRQCLRRSPWRHRAAPEGATCRSEEQNSHYTSQPASHRQHTTGFNKWQRITHPQRTGGQLYSRQEREELHQEAHWQTPLIKVPNRCPAPRKAWIYQHDQTKTTCAPWNSPKTNELAGVR